MNFILYVLTKNNYNVVLNYNNSEEPSKQIQKELTLKLHSCNIVSKDGGEIEKRAFDYFEWAKWCWERNGSSGVV